ncbi:MAG: archaeosortase/exosortase family protein [Nitrospirae bacterium]|nr:archaeosortase/exosortase family protein [Nitrospirota bacterium]
MKATSNKYVDHSVRRLVFTYILILLIAYSVVNIKIINKMNPSELLTKVLVVQATRLLNILNQNSTFTDSIITIQPRVNKSNSNPSFSMSVKFGCNGIEAMLIYASAVAAFPASWERKLLGISAGIVLIHIGNILRLTILGFVGVYYPKLFEYFHIYVLQGMMIAFALVIFFTYLHFNATKTS